MNKPKSKSKTKLSAPTPKPTEAQKTARRLEGVMQELDDVAYYFDRLNMYSQSEWLDKAIEKIAETLDTVQTLLGVPLTAGRWTYGGDRPDVEWAPGTPLPPEPIRRARGRMEPLTEALKESLITHRPIKVGA